ncbi:MAG TPA: CdaR family protein, partial [Anaerolineales bacterium]
SIQDQLASDPSAIRAWIDLTNLGQGEHTIPVHVLPNRSPVRVVHEDPAEIHLVLEPLTSRTITVTLTILGAPTLGYKNGEPVYTPTQVLVSGAASLVNQVAKIQALINISNASESIDSTISLQPIDQTGKPINGVTLTPDTINVKLPVSLLGGYRNVIVKVVTIGNVADGYKLANINATPPNVVVFSGDPQQLIGLPGYIETKPIDLSGATSDITATVPLNMPPGISVVNDQKAAVHIGILPIISRLSLVLPVTVTNVAPGLEAQITQTEVSVVLTGPVPLLNSLKPDQMSVVLDMTGKDIGEYQMAPEVASLPAGLTTESITPSPISVTLLKAPTPTRTPPPTPGPSPTPTPSPTKGPSGQLLFTQASTPASTQILMPKP